MIRGFHHTSFTVSDLDVAERFFVELFGLQRLAGGQFQADSLRRIVGFADAELRISYLAFPRTGAGRPTHVLELIQYLSPAGEPTDTSTNRPGNAHLCFEVTDVHAQHARLSDRGVRFTSAPQPVTWGANQGAWTAYCRGPDGIALELLQPPDNATEHPSPTT